MQAAKPDIKKACYHFRVYETKAVTEFNTDLRKEAFKNPVGTKDDRKEHLRWQKEKEKSDLILTGEKKGWMTKLMIPRMRHIIHLIYK